MENPRWLDLLAPLGIFAVGADVLIAPFDYAKYPKNTKSKVYVPHVIVRPDGSLLLVAQVIGSYLVVESVENGEEESDEADYTQGYLICGWVPAGGWFWASPEKRAAAEAGEAATPTSPTEGEEANVVKFSPRDG